MNDDEPKPKCCSECVHFQRLTIDLGDCEAPIPWWAYDPEFNPRIHLPETLADNCPCFLPKP
jgi:hypothetical protein